MKSHVLNLDAESVTGVFSRDLTPVLTVNSGDQIVVQSPDVLGHLERFDGPDDGVPRLLGDHPGLTVSGPIEVIGAEPGMMLAVHIKALQPTDWGWTKAAWQGSHLEDQIGVGSDAIEWLSWELDAGSGRANSAVGLSVELAPFLGIIGLPPVAPGEHSLFAPHSSGGNLDCRALTAGSTLYLPVTVPGALLSLGDGHAAQGDGEVSGTAIECGMRSTLKVELVDDAPVDVMHAETPSGRLTFGLSANLNEAVAQALSSMISWIQVLHPVNRATALALASAAVDLRITQVATPVWGVHAVLPASALRPTGGHA